MNTEFPDIMTIVEACSYLRIPRSSLYKLAQEGKIPCQKVGRHWRFYRPALVNWIANTTITGPTVLKSDNIPHSSI